MRALRHQGSARTAGGTRSHAGRAGDDQPQPAPRAAVRRRHAGRPPKDARPKKPAAAAEGDRERIRATATASCTPKRVPLSRDRRALRHALLRLFARRARKARIATSTARFAGVPHLVCYAMKANSNLAVLERLRAPRQRLRHRLRRRARARDRRRRRSGQGRVLRRRQDRARDGAGARRRHPLLQRRVGRASSSASTRSPRELGTRAPVSFRVNPDVDPKTHPYIATGLKESKFGVAFDDAPRSTARAAALPPHRRRTASTCHIGSQITELEPYREAAVEDARAGRPRSRADGIALRHVDLGGGLGIRYRDEAPVDASPSTRRSAAQTLFAGAQRDAAVRAGPAPRRRRRRAADARRVPEARRRATDFAIVDAAMNDLLRPALYDAWHPVDPVRPRDGDARTLGDRRSGLRERRFPRARPARSRSRTATCSRSAPRARTAMAMSSNYNTRPRACEVIVDGSAGASRAPRAKHVDRALRARVAAALMPRTRTHTCANAFATREIARPVFRVCESATLVRPKRRNRRRNLANTGNVARMQAAGSSGFVKWLHEMKFGRSGTACDEEKHHNSYGNSDRRNQDDGRHDVDDDAGGPVRGAEEEGR